MIGNLEAVFCPKNACQAPNLRFPRLKFQTTPHKTQANPAFPRIPSPEK
jgi:hypothetical protein